MVTGAFHSALQVLNLRGNGKGPAGSTRGVLPAGSGEIFGTLPVSGYTRPGLSVTRGSGLLAPSTPNTLTFEI